MPPRREGATRGHTHGSVGSIRPRLHATAAAQRPPRILRGLDPADAPLFPTGETAALACAACWALSSIAFTAASRRTGATGVNQFRLILACLFLGLTWTIVGIVTGFESAPPTRQTLLLGASGIVGLTLGDAALFRAFVILGARRVMLMTALAPVFVAVLAAVLLDERIGAVGILGMAITIAGIGWVVLDRSHGDDPVRGRIGEGLLLGALAAIGQATGAVLSKAGLGQAAPGSPLAVLATGSLAAGNAASASHVTPLLGTLIRLVVGCSAFLLFTIPTGRLSRVRDVWRDRPSLGWAALGTVFGPFVGVWLSLVAFAHTEAAVAQTLLALTPVLVLPANRLLTGERAAPRAYCGAFVAAVGVALLAYRHRFAGP